MAKKPTIIVDDNIPFIKGRLEKEADVRYVDQFGFTPQSIAGADAMIIRTRTRCDSALLKDSSVKLIATATIGMDQFDLPWCKENGIETVNSPGCNAPGVAQYVWSSLLRMGFDPRKNTLGVVGKGNVGSIVTEWGRAMGAEILVCDPPRQRAGHNDEEYVSIETLLENVDAVTLHTPLTRTGEDATYHLLDSNRLSLIKEGGILVNAARGPVVNTIALTEEIRNRRLHTVIDTWENEPEISLPLLQSADIATFHIAGYSLEGKQRATRMVLENVANFFSIDVDTSGLAPAYSLKGEVRPEVIVDSYNPFDDMMPLLENPEKFDRLRADYNFRKEPDFRI